MSDKPDWTEGLEHRSPDDNAWLELVTTLHHQDYRLFFQLIEGMTEAEMKRMILLLSVSLTSLMKSVADHEGMSHDEFLRESAVMFAQTFDGDDT